MLGRNEDLQFEYQKEDREFLSHSKIVTKQMILAYNEIKRTKVNSTLDNHATEIMLAILTLRS